MIQHLLEESKLLFVFLVLFSCKEKKKENIMEYSYPSIIINNTLKKEISSYKEDLRRMQAEESNNICLFFSKRNDSIFIEIGDYKPNLRVLHMKGVEMIKKDTVYLFVDDEHMNINNFYNNKSAERVKIIHTLKPSFDYYDPHFRCLYSDKKNINILSYNNKCK